MKPFSLENPSAGFKIALKGYVQADFRSFQDWTAGDEDSGDAARRRVRVAAGAHRHRGRVEAAARSRSDVDPAFDEGDELKDAWVGLRLVEGASRSAAGT